MTAKYAVGDIVVTREKVACKAFGSGGSDGWCDPGWLWRVVGVEIRDRTLRYAVVAHKASWMYRQSLKENQVAKKVGVHAP